MEYLALLTCTECGGIVSNLAACCPHCGCPIEVIVHASNSGMINDKTVKEKNLGQDKENYSPIENDDVIDDELSDDLCAEALIEKYMENEGNINVSGLYDIDLDDDPFHDPLFNWDQYANGGMYPLKSSTIDDIDDYDIEDMGLDPNFYAGDGNNF